MVAWHFCLDLVVLGLLEVQVQLIRDPVKRAIITLALVAMRAWVMPMGVMRLTTGLSRKTLMRVMSARKGNLLLSQNYCVKVAGIGYGDL